MRTLNGQYFAQAQPISLFLDDGQLLKGELLSVRADVKTNSVVGFTESEHQKLNTTIG